MNESHAVQSSTNISADDSSIGSTRSSTRAIVDDATKRNDGEEDGRNEGKAVGSKENKDSSSNLDSEFIENMTSTMRSACFDKDWKLLEDFLSDDKSSISNVEKRIIFQNKHTNICRLALYLGAPLRIVKGMIDLMDPKSQQFLIFADSGSA